MDTNKIIEAAKKIITSHSGYHYRPEVVASAVAEGLIDGDRVMMGTKGGQAIYATVLDGVVTMTLGGDTIQSHKISDLSDAQHAQIITLKAVQANK